MRQSLHIVVFLCLIATLPLRAQSPGRATLTGRVVDESTGEPLSGAHIFIASSTMGTATDESGHYTLAGVPVGAHRLYVSMLGYESGRQDTLLLGAATYEIDFVLRPTVVEMEEVTVTARTSRRWRRRLRRFERLFLGESENAEHTRLLNPEVLSFDGGWGKLVATASAPLVIENRALGYRLTYFLEEFEYRGGVLRYDGEPLFEELIPEGPEQAERWARNRLQAFHGSFRHYMLSILDGSSRDQGFKTFRRMSLEDVRRIPAFRTDPASLLREGPSPSVRTLRFRGYVEVLYLREAEEEAYLRWQGRSPWDTREAQRSWFKLTDGPTLVDQHGEVVDPYGVTVYGYFAFERIADLVPKEYRPDEANSTGPIRGSGE